MKPVHTFAITVAFQTVGPLFRRGTIPILTSGYPAGLHGQAMDKYILQVIRDCINAMRLHLVHVWVACARKGYSSGFGASKVG